MRVRYEIYRWGKGTGTEVKTDMTEKEARKYYRDLSANLRCGWAELVGEDEENYMDVIESFNHISTARDITSIFG